MNRATTTNAHIMGIVEAADLSFRFPFICALEDNTYGLLYAAMPADAVPPTPHSRAVFRKFRVSDNIEFGPGQIIETAPGAGNRPVLWRVDQNRILYADFRWEFLPPDGMAKFKFKIDGHDGWINYDGSFTRAAELRGDELELGSERKITFPEADKTTYPVIFHGPNALPLADGGLLVPCHTAERRSLFDSRNFLLRTDDAGETWSPHGTLETRETRYAALHEAAVLPIGGNAMLAVLQTTNKFDYLMSTMSEDGGRTWPRPERTEMQGHPPQLFDLGGGRIVCIHALRPSAQGAKNTGLRMVISEDSGKTWLTDDVVNITADILPDTGIANPHTIKISEKEFLTAFEVHKPGEPSGLKIVRYGV